MLKMGGSKKMVIGIITLVLIIIASVVPAYILFESSVTNREASKFTDQSSIANNAKTVNEEKNIQNFSKVIDNIKLELDIPNDWKYEEVKKNDENDFYRYALKIYKNNENQYAMLYFYNNQFAVCGTGRESENIILNNGSEATIGYYGKDKDWTDISFHSMNKDIAIMNYGLTGTEADEIVQFIKTINITKG